MVFLQKGSRRQSRSRNFFFNFYIVSVFADFVKICDEMGYFKFGVDRG